MNFASLYPLGLYIYTNFGGPLFCMIFSCGARFKWCLYCYFSCYYNHNKFQSKALKYGYCLGNLVVGGMIILKLTSKREFEVTNWFCVDYIHAPLPTVVNMWINILVL